MRKKRGWVTKQGAISGQRDWKKIRSLLWDRIGEKMKRYKNSKLVREGKDETYSVRWRLEDGEGRKNILALYVAR